MQIILNFPDDMTVEEVEGITRFFDWEIQDRDAAFQRLIAYEIKHTRCSTCPERLQRGDEFQECGKKGPCIDVKPKCPNCHGEGFIRPLIPHGTFRGVPCDICNGAGKLPEDIEYDQERGRKVKVARLDEGFTLREWCLKTGCDVQERSRQERGYFRLEDVKP